MTSCDKYTELISAAVDGEISDADRSALEAHLDTCPECRELMETFSAISENFPMDAAVPDNFAAGTMAKIRAEAARPTGLRRFISGYGKYTGLAAALVVVLLGFRAFSGRSENLSADTAMRGDMQSNTTAAEGELYDIVADSEAKGDMLFSASGSGQYVAPSDPAPEAAPEEAAGSAPSEPENSRVHFSDGGSVLDLDAFYSEHGLRTRYYGIYQLSAPAPEALSELLASEKTECVYSSEDEQQYSAPMALLNRLDPGIFSEIVFDDLTAEYGLVVIIN